MSVLVDTSIVIDYLRGDARAAELLEKQRAGGLLHASEMTRLEVRSLSCAVRTDSADRPLHRDSSAPRWRQTPGSVGAPR